MRLAALRKFSNACGPSFISAGTVLGFMGIDEGGRMECVKGIATFHGNNPPDAWQSAGGLSTFCGVQPRRTGHPPFDFHFYCAADLATQVKSTDFVV
jgi:hypothetical protein